MEDISLRVKKGAKRVGKLLKMSVTGNRDYLDLSNGLWNFDDATPNNELIEIPVKKISNGELFGHDDIVNQRDRCTSTLKCVSMRATVYQITKEVNYIYIYIY